MELSQQFLQSINFNKHAAVRDWHFILYVILIAIYSLNALLWKTNVALVTLLFNSTLPSEWIDSVTKSFIQQESYAQIPPNYSLKQTASCINTLFNKCEKEYILEDLTVLTPRTLESFGTMTHLGDTFSTFASIETSADRAHRWGNKHNIPFKTAEYFWGILVSEENTFYFYYILSRYACAGKWKRFVN